jgi:hypothetical protein
MCGSSTLSFEAVHVPFQKYIVPRLLPRTGEIPSQRLVQRQEQVAERTQVRFVECQLLSILSSACISLVHVPDGRSMAHLWFQVAMRCKLHCISLDID